MATQIEIGLEVAGYAKDDIASGVDADTALNGLIRQCLGRDEGWKAFYSEHMEKVETRGANERLLAIYGVELEAEELYIAGDYSGAVQLIQNLMDDHKFDAPERGWYLQIMARYSYPLDRTEFNRLQLAAHGANRMVMKPPQGLTVTKLSVISQGRVERIAQWIRDHNDYAQLDIALADILGRLVFGVKADKFEQALDELSRALGFAGERPDKEWKEGPDNLWALDDANYIVWECKDEVDLSRAEINKTEAEQMNRSAAWFKKNYEGCTAIHIEIHPAHQVQSAANFLVDVKVMRVKELNLFVKAVKNFFQSFQRVNFKDLSLPHIQNLLVDSALDVDNLLKGGFTKKTFDRK